MSFKDSKSKNKLAFDTHFDELLRKYSRVYVLNLRSGQDKQDEVKISQAMLNLPRRVARARRKIRGQTPTIYYFHQVDDPYSLIMAQQLERFAAMISLDITPYLVSGPNDAFKGDASRFDDWALRDAASIASFLGDPLPIPDGLEQAAYPPPDQSTAANASLLAALHGGHSVSYTHLRAHET